MTGIGTGQFTGIGGCHSFTYSNGGPEGTAIHKDTLIAGNGNSHVLFFNKESGTRLANVHTGGSLRADEMAIAKGNLIVTNPDEVPHPYITFINLQTYTIKATFVFTDAVGALEQPQYWAGHLFISVPTSAQSPNGGEVDELDISHLEHIHIMHRFAFVTCQPGGLSIRGDGIAAVGCGGLKNTSQVILNLNNGHQTVVRGISGVDIVDVYRGDFFWVSYATAQFFISDVHGRILQTFPATHASHTVTVDTSNGDVWVPQDKGDVNLYTLVNEEES